MLKNKLNRFLKKLFIKKIIKPIYRSKLSVSEISTGVAIGMFWGLTPTVGIQMFIVFVHWLLWKYIFGKNFDLLVATAMVWISNPFTIGFFYTLFLLTGNFFLSIFGIKSVNVEQFFQNFTVLQEQSHYSTLETIYYSLQYLLVEIGLPLVVGSLVYAIIGSIISYAVVKNWLLFIKGRSSRYER